MCWREICPLLLEHQQAALVAVWPKSQLSKNKVGLIFNPPYFSLLFSCLLPDHYKKIFLRIIQTHLDSCKHVQRKETILETHLNIIKLQTSSCQAFILPQQHRNLLSSTHLSRIQKELNYKIKTHNFQLINIRKSVE